MQVRRKLLLWALGDKSRIKALSLLLTLKSKLGRSQTIHEASQNKIARIAGVSPSTIRRYMVIWRLMGLVEWRGCKGDVLVVNRLSSKTKHRNVEINRIDFKDFKTIYEQIKSFLFLLILSCKAYVKRMIRTVNTSRDADEVKKALKFCNCYAKRTEDNRLEYVERGISYSRIGEKLGFCKRSAEDIVKKAVQKRWCRKFNHFEPTYMKGVNWMYVEGYTFTTRDYGYVVRANTYSVNRNILMALIGGKK